jgi:hypothetical protein
MKRFTLTYSYIGDKGELIQHKEEYPTRISAIINYWFANHDRRKVWVTLKENKK